MMQQQEIQTEAEEDLNNLFVLYVCIYNVYSSNI